MVTLDIVRKGLKIRLTRTLFCMGIGLDQLTPEYYCLNIEIPMGIVQVNTKPVSNAIHTKPVNTKSLYKPNYNRRVIQKGK